jgi:hypothetical protein
MPNTKDWKKGKKNILVYGPTGTGKTQLFATIPGKKLIYMFDPTGLDTLSGLDIDYEYFPPDSSFAIGRTKHGARDPKGPKQKEPVAYANFEDHYEELLKGRIEEYDAVGFDSLTSLQYMLLDRIAYINNRYGQINELSDYMIAGDSMLKILQAAFSCSPIIYVTGHSDLIQDEISKKVQNTFDVIKNVRRLLPRNLSDLWVSSVNADQTSVKFSIQTLPSREWPSAKNSMNLNFIEDVTLDFNKPLEEQGIGRFLRGGDKRLSNKKNK